MSDRSPHGVLRMSVNPAKYFKMKNPMMEEDLKGSAGLTPDLELDWEVFWQNTTAATTIDLDYSITLEWIVVFTEPKALAFS